MTVSIVVPSDEIRSFTACCAPRPSATTAITAPTPITMPSIVSSERSLLTRSALSATAMISLRRMLARRRRSGGRRRTRSATGVRARAATGAAGARASARSGACTRARAGAALRAALLVDSGQPHAALDALLQFRALLLKHRRVDERDVVAFLQAREHLSDVVVADAEHGNAGLEGAVGGDEDEPRMRTRIARRRLLIAAAHGQCGP